MTYEDLLIEAENEGLKIKEKPLKYGFKGLCKNKKILIDKKIKTSKEKNCILAEEVGHYKKSYGNILDYADIKNIKQEKIARNWGYEKLVGIVKLINAFKKGIRNKYDLAEYLDVTVEFLEQAIQHYREKYGAYYEIDMYTIYFEPYLTILKKY